MNLKVIKVSKNELNAFLANFSKVAINDSVEPYVRLVIESGDYNAKVYDNNKKDYYKVVFKGSNFPLFLNNYEEISQTTKTLYKQEKINTFPQIGSDEVGFGDFFGPLVVVAALVTKEQLSFLETYRIKDSKKLSDDYILTIGPLLAEKIVHIKNIVNNEKYNEVIGKGYNMNQMKAMLHVNVLQKLSVKYPNIPLYLDEFTSEEKFLVYTKMMEVPKIFPVTKGEENAISIAVASVLARYYFLLSMNEISQRLGVMIPKGASAEVDTFALRLIEEKGVNIFKKVTKHNFRNYKDLIVNYPELVQKP